MKKIVNGKRFDSEKGIEIGTASYNGPSSDFQWWEATLYKTPRSGAFFLVGEGGPMSRYARSVGQNEWTGGSDLTPLSREEAFGWAQQYLDANLVEEHFGDLIEEA